MCGFPAYIAIVKKELRQHSSESQFILNTCKLHNLVYIYAAVLIDWINWLHRALHEHSCSCHRGTCESRQDLPATVWRKNTGSSLSECVLALDSAVTQMTSAVHGGDFLPSSHCLIPVWETLLLHVYYTVSCYLARVYPMFRHLLTVDQEKNQKRTTSTPKTIALTSLSRVSVQCFDLRFGNPCFSVTLPSHYFFAYSHILFLSCNHLLSISRRGSCVSIVS